MAALALGQRLSQGVPTRAPLLRQPSPLGRPALAFRPSAPQAWLARRGERLAAAALQEVAPPPWEYGDGGIFADPEAEPGEYGYGSSPRGPPSPSSSSSSTATGLRPLPRDVEGVADDASLGNPLQRMERLGTAWFGTIFELDGVCIGEQRSRGAIHEGCGGVGAARRKQRQQLGTEPCLAQLSCATGAYCRSPASEQPLPSVGPPLLPPLTTLAEYECGDGGRSWQALAAEEGKSPPPLWALKKARGMKNEQVWFALAHTVLWGRCRGAVEVSQGSEREDGVGAPGQHHRKPLPGFAAAAAAPLLPPFLLALHLLPCSPLCLPQVVTEVFNWTRNPVEARRLAQRREAILGELLGRRKPMVPPGVEQLMDILQVRGRSTRLPLRP